MAHWFSRRPKANPPSEPGSPVPAAPADEPRLGWCLVTFLNDVLEPAENGLITGTELFVRYRQWCADNRLVPKLEADFIDELAKLALEVGIPLKQTGGHVVGFGVRTRGRIKGP